MDTSMISNKKEVMKALYPIFKKDEKMVLLIGDMGFAVLEEYTQNHSERAFNIGICEQASVSIAAGMQMAGLKPIIYSQIPFLTMRAYEQIRYDICEHNLPVILIGVGADNYFKALGRSHCMDNDDIKLMSILPNIEIISGDIKSISSKIVNFDKIDHPVYLRCV